MSQSFPLSALPLDTEQEENCTQNCAVKLRNPKGKVPGQSSKMNLGSKEPKKKMAIHHSAFLVLGYVSIRPSIPWSIARLFLVANRKRKMET